VAAMELLLTLSHTHTLTKTFPLLFPTLSHPLSPRVTFCGYSIPHPSEAVVNIRIQTTGECEGEREGGVCAGA
jgi:DNA-directed RNA polymerase subunit L